MRNRNTKYPDEFKNRARPVSPYDEISPYEYVELVCSTCKKRINDLNVLEVQWTKSNNGPSFDRIHFYTTKDAGILERALRLHPCLAEQNSIREDEYIQEQKEVMADIQRELDRIYAEPAAEEIFRMGMWVINTASGHTFKIESQETYDTIVGGYKNGKRNIEPYE